MPSDLLYLSWFRSYTHILSFSTMLMFLPLPLPDFFLILKHVARTARWR